ncbi:hypothetical protein GGI12_000073 [Dipsacomyces acuminosporus]|nr:hypothetical protein GGI12_000073 [Dipsacomyces acuminosporus]
MAHFYIPAHSDCGSAASDYFHPPVRKDMLMDISVKKLYAIRNAQRATHRQPRLYKTVLVYNMFKSMANSDKAAGPEEPSGGQMSSGEINKEWQQGKHKTLPVISEEAAECSNTCGSTDHSAQPASQNISASINTPPTRFVPANYDQESHDSAMDVDLDNVHIDIAFDSSGSSDDQIVEEITGAAAAEAEQSWFDRCIDSMLTDDDQDQATASQQPLSLSSDEDEDDDNDDDYECDLEAAVVLASGFQRQPNTQPPVTKPGHPQAIVAKQQQQQQQQQQQHGLLKRSPSSASIPSLYMAADQKMQLQMIDHTVTPAAAVDGAGWQEPTFGSSHHMSIQHWERPDLFVLSSVSLDKSSHIY